MAKKGSELPKAKGDRIEGNGNTSRVHFSKSRGGISSEEFESKTKPILQYWFLLETEMYEAIMKGNLSLMPVATARVNYLKKVIPANLLGEGIRGEEDALWRIHRILRNNGWWERAGNLVISEQSQGMPTNSDPLYQFLQLHSHLVHPNTRKLVAKGVREGIRMALNQIHYGSIEEARKKKTGLSPKDDTNVARPSKFPTSVTTIPSKIMVEFISSFRHLVEPSVYRDAMRGHDKALSLALGQIHHKTLPLDSQQESHADELQYEVGPSVLPDIEKDISEGDLNGEVMDNAATHNSAHLNDRIMDDIISHNPDIEGDNISEINDTSDVEVEDSLLNPLTPRPSTSSDHIPTSGTRDQINQSDHSVEKVEIFQTANWKPREKESSISMVQMQSDQDKSTSDYNPVDDLSDLCSSHPSILKDLKNLKVQSKRGRPRKPSSKHLNKHFKVPRKKKVKGEGLKQCSHFFLNSSYDEAEAIYETGVLMGLLPVNSKENSLKMIKENLV
ncbi:hypothetical protein ACET3Z_003770 [Daucus carota]